MTIRALLHLLTRADEPWFRRRRPIGYYPINKAGWITSIAMILAVFTFGALFVSIGPANATLGWVFGGVAAACAFAGHVLIMRHMAD